MEMGNTFALLINQRIKGLGAKESNKAKAFLLSQMELSMREILRPGYAMVKAK